MNRKGFTLVELLATVVILAIVMSIATMGVIGAINKSKEKSEKIFTDKLATAIEGYLAQKGSSLTNVSQNPDLRFEKCNKYVVENNKVTNKCEKDEYKKIVSVNELESINLKTITEKTNTYIPSLESKDIVNPKNKKNCLEKSGVPQIKIFKDTDYVYYYYMNLSKENTSCDISEDNAIVTNIPESLCTSLSGTYKDGKCKL